LVKELIHLADKWGLEHRGLLTITTPDNCTDKAAAEKRFNSFNTHFLRLRHNRVIVVAERQKRGEWHFHCVVVLEFDARTGFNFDEVVDKSLASNIRYRSACRDLKAEWAVLRRVCPPKATADKWGPGILDWVGRNCCLCVLQRKGWLGMWANIFQRQPSGGAVWSGRHVAKLSWSSEPAELRVGKLQRLA
jgi:hypothetical protein